jgi:hypothetical protein
MLLTDLPKSFKMFTNVKIIYFGDIT